MWLQIVNHLANEKDVDQPKAINDKWSGCTNVLKDCKLEKEEKNKLNFFNVIGVDLFHLGGTNSLYGALVGIPFMFEESNQINYSNLRLQGHDTIDWVIDGQDLLDALNLSDKAKKFGLMREIYSCNIWDTMDNAFISTGCFLFPAAFIRKINVKRDDVILKLSLGRRLGFYLLCYAVGYTFYRCLKDPLKHLTAKKHDKMSAETGPDYLEGGIEFYKKALMRNKALRDLMGPRGEKMYDKDGNENYFLLAPKLPIRKRLEYLQNLKTEQETVPA
ncbi:uncharacterized protein CEXT_405611 [Caerostris extrusa]|uniref:Transmembrane protein 177 n=1 Tax=Caerostris extrusa TaxID=172846 RepID=A0AAV4U7V4_CAEEX|nr:uncharacterized protein CEXT_405611 [Caerostris extrusa]